ncbi:hypothetical protein VNO80_26981 [Phaseolus coccineus]|uniref:Protein kinase domain-containing protein n=1 Tax=Phaseolus coccineus TaxID=3886 RepID=A0AAN9LFQ4_PHACN
MPRAMAMSVCLSRPGDARMPRALAMSACLSRAGDIRMSRALAMTDDNRHAWLKYTPPIDIWSIGCIFAEVLTGNPLFLGKSVMHQLDLITDLLGTPSPETIAGKSPVPSERKFPNADPLALLLLQRLLASDPKDRPTAQEALSDNFKALAKDERELSFPESMSRLFTIVVAEIAHQVKLEEIVGVVGKLFDAESMIASKDFINRMGSNDVWGEGIGVNTNVDFILEYNMNTSIAFAGLQKANVFLLVSTK